MRHVYLVGIKKSRLKEIKMLKRFLFLFAILTLTGSDVFGMQNRLPRFTRIENGIEYEVFTHLNVNSNNLQQLGFEILTINGIRLCARRVVPVGQMLIQEKPKIKSGIKKDVILLSNIIFKAIIYSEPKKSNKCNYSLRSFLTQIGEKEFSKLTADSMKEVIFIIVKKITSNDESNKKLYKLFVDMTYDLISEVTDKSIGLGWLIGILDLKTKDKFFDLKDLKSEISEREKLLAKLCGTKIQKL